MLAMPPTPVGRLLPAALTCRCQLGKTLAPSIDGIIIHRQAQWNTAPHCSTTAAGCAAPTTDALYYLAYRVRTSPAAGDIDPQMGGIASSYNGRLAASDQL